MPFADVRDLSVYCELAGNGPRLLAISGSGGDLRRQAQVHTAFLDDFTVLAYDQRGLGQTTIPDPPYTMQDYADDAAALLDVLGWDRCHVMGTSFGGMVAQEFAIRHPLRVERMVLNCTSSGGTGRPSYPLHELSDLDPEQRFRTTLPISDTRQDAAWQAAHADTVETMRQDFLARQELGAGEPRHELGARAQLDARRRHDVYDRLPQLEMPVLVCAGRYDGIAPPKNAEAIVRQIPNAELAFFEGGHGFFRQDETAYPRMIAFLRADAGT